MRSIVIPPGIPERTAALQPKQEPLGLLGLQAMIAAMQPSLRDTLYVLLDNASINKSREFIRHIPKWVKRGLIIKYLPPYSPELNLIEILWRFMKYYWLPFSAYMSFQCLLQSVEDILTRFGTDYTIDFEIK
jgi:hypothetical protein